MRSMMLDPPDPGQLVRTDAEDCAQRTANVTYRLYVPRSVQEQRNGWTMRDDKADLAGEVRCRVTSNRHMRDIAAVEPGLSQHGANGQRRKPRPMLDAP